ncbi:hypothetical protein MKW98_021544 [Papaver atlanticum]|uniref:Large ribosomal subunit protein uL15/eL18 domain-containing protein n=1 Tax=Papaver atlanticum TaxID=357466 RepID=A0AAD4XTY1_9MAGN|nr:hypothetical protein MKW98_021544 [Papaver atlanticum]
MASSSLLSLSTSFPTTRVTRVHSLASSPFKGNVSTLKTSSSQFPSLRGKQQQKSLLVKASSASIPTAVVSSPRLRLDNLGPQPGSRHRQKRKGRGIAAGQGNSCGFGMRGQKSRSGPGIRRGFEGGQMPLYRRVPKLRGIAGGMKAGLPKYLPVNLKDIATAGFKDGEEVSLESLKSKGLINPSGRERRLPLKILGTGDLDGKLIIKAGSFSASAKEKLEAVGCTMTVIPGRKKWVKPSVTKNIARADAYFAKKRAEAATAAEAASA